jgi:hypothetical protein
MSEQMKRHFVTFYSPGTFVAETTTKPITAWNVEAACALAAGINERHGARPYGFRFSTRARGPDDLDSREVASSAMYYLGGTVETLAEVEARNDPSERILLSNMRGNGYDRIVRSGGPGRWSWTQPLCPDDVVISA